MGCKRGPYECLKAGGTSANLKFRKNDVDNVEKVFRLRKWKREIGRKRSWENPQANHFPKRGSIRFPRLGGRA